MLLKNMIPRRKLVPQNNYSTSSIVIGFSNIWVPIVLVLAIVVDCGLWLYVGVARVVIICLARNYIISVV